MDQDTDQLRAQIDQQRAEIATTVDQIENRVSPSSVLARRRDRIRRRLTDWTDAVLGNDQPDYPPPRTTGRSASTKDTSKSSADLRQRLEETAADASETVQQAPVTVRRQTRGNPMAAGAIALGAGWLIGSILPESRQERKAVGRVEPQLSDAATAVQQEGRELAEDLRQPARQAVDEVKQTGQEAAAEVSEHSKAAARNVKDQVGS